MTLSEKKRKSVLAKARGVHHKPHMRAGKDGRSVLVKAYARIHALATPELVHKICKDKGIDYESKRFMDICQEVTGKRHLDDMTPSMLTRIAKRFAASHENDTRERRANLAKYGLA